MNNGRRDGSGTVSVIMRTIDARFNYLARSIFSVYCNDYPDIQLVIVYQGTDRGYMESLAYFAETYPELNIKIVNNPTDKDERAKNLNLGITGSSGRYICFLDDDDVFYPNHISTLVRAIQSSGKAWAYSQSVADIECEGYVTKKQRMHVRETFKFTELWWDNYIPIHTFMLDTHKIDDKSLIAFDERFERLEDYSFLVKLAYHYEPERCGEITCLYKVRTDGSNTITLYDNSERNRQIWENARALMGKLREDLSSQVYWAREYLMTDSRVKEAVRVKSRKPSWARKAGLNNIELFFRKKLRDPIRAFFKKNTVKE